MTTPTNADAKPFQIGDIVHLISGSPRLTIVAINDQVITCAWFAWPENHLHKGDLPAAALTRRSTRVLAEPEPFDSPDNPASPESQGKPDFQKPVGKAPSFDVRQFGNADPNQETPF